MPHSQFPLIRRLRLVAMVRRLAAAWSAAGIAFVLLLTECFVPCLALQWMAISLTGVSLFACWTAIVGWRMPVFAWRTLVGLSLVWLAGMGVAVLLVATSFRPDRPLVWQASVQWLSFALSLALGSLLFRALFYRRQTPVWGRVMSLLSPLIIAALIIGHFLYGTN